MEQNFINGRNETEDVIAMASLHSRYVLNVALVYQDALTAQWARQTLHRMAEMVDKQTIRCTEWKIDDLRQRSVFSEGVAAMAQANVIVVSLHETERLPAAFCLWVNVWLQERAGRAGAMVALVVRPEEANPGSNETRRYLYAVASQGRLEFSIRECNQSSEPIPDPREYTLQWAKAA